MPRPLNASQLRFVDEYLIDQVAWKAALRAGYTDRSRAVSTRMMKNPQIKAAIEAGLKAQQTRTLITADQVLLDIQRVGDKAEREADWSNALRSRELLGKRYKLFTDKVEITNVAPRAERLRAARERRQKA